MKMGDKRDVNRWGMTNMENGKPKRTLFVWLEEKEELLHCTCKSQTQWMMRKNDKNLSVSGCEPKKKGKFSDEQEKDSNERGR